MTGGVTNYLLTPKKYIQLCRKVGLRCRQCNQDIDVGDDVVVKSNRHVFVYHLRCARRIGVYDGSST